MITLTDWSPELRERYRVFLKNARFHITDNTILLSEETAIKLIELINYAREEAEIAANEGQPDCDSCDRIHPDDVGEYCAERSGRYQ